MCASSWRVSAAAPFASVRPQGGCTDLLPPAMVTDACEDTKRELIGMLKESAMDPTRESEYAEVRHLIGYFDDIQPGYKILGRGPPDHFEEDEKDVRESRARTRSDLII